MRTNISGNTAVDLDEFLEDLSRFSDKTKDIVAPIRKHIASGREALLYCGEGGGGGVCLLLNQIPDRALANIMLFGSVIENNEAINGGEQLSLFIRPRIDLQPQKEVE